MKNRHLKEHFKIPQLSNSGSFKPELSFRRFFESEKEAIFLISVLRKENFF